MTLLKILTLMTSIALTTPKASHKVDSTINEPHNPQKKIEHSKQYKMLNFMLMHGKESSIEVGELMILSSIIYALAVIAHESGHAITSASLYDLDKTPQIHIGVLPGDSSEKLFSIGNITFYNAMWIGGYTQGTDNYFQTSTAKEGIISAAGGVSAAATLYGLLSIITTYCSYNDDDKSVLSAAVSGLKNGISPFASILAANNLSYEKKRFLLNACFIACTSIIGNLFYGLTPLPLFKYGDGMVLWRDIMRVNDNKLMVAQSISIAATVGSYVLLFKNFYAARATLSAQYKMQIDTQEEQIVQLLTKSES